MKTINKKKFVVTALTTTMAAALVGSISGSIAWYQYSTRATMGFQGTSAHCTENLEIRLRYAAGTFKPDLSVKDIADYLTWTERTNANGLTPVTPAAGQLALGEVATSFKGNAEYQKSIAQWKDADGEAYIVLPLELRVKDINGKGNSYISKNIYLSDLDLAAAHGNTGADLSEALRVSLSSGLKTKLDTVKDKAAMEAIVGPEDDDIVFVAKESCYYQYDAGESKWEKVAGNALDNYTTFSKTGEDVNAYGVLDLNNDGKYDRTNDYQWDLRQNIVYGFETANYYVVDGDAADVEHLPADPVNYQSGDLYTVGEKYYQFDGSSWFEVTVENTDIVGNKELPLPTHKKGGAEIDYTSAPVLKAAEAAQPTKVDSAADLPVGLLPADKGALYYVEDTDGNADNGLTPQSKMWNGTGWTDLSTVGQVAPGIANDDDSSNIYGAKKLGTTTALNVQYFAKSTEFAAAAAPAKGDAAYVAETNKYYFCKTAGNWGDALDSIQGEMSDLCVKVDVRIYLEGWQQLAASATAANNATWNDKALNAKFNVGLRFSADAHETH